MYRICTRCVMDTTDPEITFSVDGVCNHCVTFDKVLSKGWYPNGEGHRLLQARVGEISLQGKGQPYDCIMGLSGGVDSSYLALKVRELGLRPLVVHVDAGWNTEIAVSNIEKVVRHCGFKLHTEVINWEEMRDLQRAYFLSGVANQDVPQDHAFAANLYHYAVANNIKTVISGGNIATESVLPKSWQTSAMDVINLRAIHSAFGRVPLRTFKTVSFFQYYLWYPWLRGVRTLRPLDYLPYRRAEAIAELEGIGWKPYGRKHGESFFTRFFQNYYLPTKFGYDKRRPHYSSLILSGQLTRESALKSLQEPLYDPRELEEDKLYFCKKIGITRKEFEEVMSAPGRRHTAFANWDSRHRLLKRVQVVAERILGRRVNVYS